MHWLKLVMEGWVVFGAVTVVAGALWTSHLSRQMKPEHNKIPAASDRQFGTASLSKITSA
ncbi:MAG: hypothetical protein WAL32_07440 [Terriglobales bacterium]